MGGTGDGAADMGIKTTISESQTTGSKPMAVKERQSSSQMADIWAC